MNEAAKRKGPPTKEEVISKAVNLGVGTAEELEYFSVKEIRAKMNLYNAGYTEPETIPCNHPESSFHRIRVISSPNNLLFDECMECGYRRPVEL